MAGNRIHLTDFWLNTFRKFFSIKQDGVNLENKTGALLAPVKMKIRYTLTVKADEVPAGEVVRVWMPYPRTDVAAHKDITLISASQPQYLIAPDRRDSQEHIYGGCH